MQRRNKKKSDCWRSPSDFPSRKLSNSNIVPLLTPDYSQRSLFFLSVLFSLLSKVRGLKEWEKKHGEGGRKKNPQSSQTLATEAPCLVDISALLSGMVSQMCA